MHGTEDAPVITSGAQAGSVTEDADWRPNENTDTHHQSGAVTFTDVDLSDLETQFDHQHAASRDAGQRLRADDRPSTMRWSMPSRSAAASHSTTDGTGTIGWHYDLADSAIDFLGANDVVTLTYTVQVDDGNGGIKTQDVTITVHGTEDAPVITSGPQAGLGHRRRGRRAGREHRHPSSVRRGDLHRRRPVRPRDELDRQHATVGDAGQRLRPDARPSTTRWSVRSTIGAAPHSTTDRQRHHCWHYDLADSALDFLGANDRGDADLYGAGRRRQRRHQDPGRHHHGARHRGQAGDHLGCAVRIGDRRSGPRRTRTPTPTIGPAR